MNMRTILDPETTQINDIKMEVRNLEYEKLITLATGQRLLILDYEKMIIDKIGDEQTNKELLESMEFYVQKNDILDKKTLLKYIEEIRDLL